MTDHPDLRFVVSAEDAGTRLDAWLARRVDGLSRRRALAWISEGKVRVNGRRLAKGAVLADGDEVVLSEAPPPASFDPIPDPGVALALAYEDADVVVVDKPAGVACHPLRHDERGTLANALVARFPELVGVGYAPREPGLLHRLDTGTSGLLLVARNAEAFDKLREALRAGEVDKRYLALAAGVVERDAGTLDVPLAPHPRDPRRMLACTHPRDAARYHARPAVTRYEVRERLAAYTLLEVSVEAATRHQIRAHLAAAGHPLAGDTLYGGPVVAALERQFLHASSLAFPHPRTGRRVQVRSELPADLARVLDEAARPDAG